MDISDLTKKLPIINNHEKEETRPYRKEKVRPSKTELINKSCGRLGPLLKIAPLSQNIPFPKGPPTVTCNP
jgi:hypothetical protein